MGKGANFKEPVKNEFNVQGDGNNVQGDGNSKNPDKKEDVLNFLSDLDKKGECSYRVAMAILGAFLR